MLEAKQTAVKKKFSGVVRFFLDYGMRKECNLLQSNSHTRTSKEAEELMEKQRKEEKKRH